VIASNTWAAIEGRKKLKLEWEGGPNAGYDSVEYRKALSASAGKPGEGREPAGGPQRTGGQELQEFATIGGLSGE
jgi:hypothetical protein